MNITILGGGASARAYAAELAIKNHNICIYEVPELFHQMNEIKKNQGIFIDTSSQLNDISCEFAPIIKITSQITDAIKDADIIFITIPSKFQLSYADLIAPLVKSGQTIVFTPTIMGASIYLNRKIRCCGNKAEPLIIEVEYIRHASVVSSNERIKISGIKKGLSYASFPSKNKEAAASIVTKIFQDWNLCDNIFEVALRNMNAILHVPLMVLSANQIESQKPFAFYHEGCTKSVANVVNMIEQERLKIGEALKLNMMPLEKVLKEWYEAEESAWSTLGEALRLNTAYKSIKAPKTLNHRFLTEDVPYGLVPLESLAKAVKVKTPIISSLISLSYSLLDDLRSVEPHTLKRIGLNNYCVEDLLHLAEYGFDN